MRDVKLLFYMCCKYFFLQVPLLFALYHTVVIHVYFLTLSFHPLWNNCIVLYSMNCFFKNMLIYSVRYLAKESLSYSIAIQMFSWFFFFMVLHVVCLVLYYSWNLLLDIMNRSSYCFLANNQLSQFHVSYELWIVCILHITLPFRVTSTPRYTWIYF